jgi:hypothetical protein
VPGADLSGVDVVVGEVLVGDGPVVVADQPVRLDQLGIEGDCVRVSRETTVKVPMMSSTKIRSTSANVSTYA